MNLDQALHKAYWMTIDTDDDDRFQLAQQIIEEASVYDSKVCADAVVDKVQLPIVEGQYIAVGNDEIKGQEVNNGDKAMCPHCSNFHPVAFGIDKATGEPSKMLIAVDCTQNGHSYLVGLGGRLFT